ncbi:MAG: hypothetical protein Q9191_005354 [Dirinaria sp. TL-2023a]
MQGRSSNPSRELVDLYTIPPRTLTQRLTSIVCLPFSKPSKPLPILDPHYSTSEDLAAGRNRQERVPTFENFSKGSISTYTRFPPPRFSNHGKGVNITQTEQVAWRRPSQHTTSLAASPQPSAPDDGSTKTEGIDGKEQSTQNSPLHPHTERHLITPSPSPTLPSLPRQPANPPTRKSFEPQTAAEEEAERFIYHDSVYSSFPHEDETRGYTDPTDLSDFPAHTHAFLSRRPGFDTQLRSSCRCHLCRLASECRPPKGNEISLRGGGDNGGNGRRRLGDEERVNRALWFFAGGVGEPPTGQELREWKRKYGEQKQRRRTEKQAKQGAAKENKKDWWKLVRGKFGKKKENPPQPNEEQPAPMAPTAPTGAMGGFGGTEVSEVTERAEPSSGLDAAGSSVSELTPSAESRR